MAFRAAKKQVLDALTNGSFLHEARNEIDEKNLLSTGAITPAELIDIIKRCNGTHHSESPRHAVNSVSVNVLKKDGWYIKFYFLDPNVMFISVHQ